MPQVLQKWGLPFIWGLTHMSKYWILATLLLKDPPPPAISSIPMEVFTSVIFRLYDIGASNWKGISIDYLC